MPFTKINLQILATNHKLKTENKMMHVHNECMYCNQLTTPLKTKVEEYEAESFNIKLQGEKTQNSSPDCASN